MSMSISLGGLLSFEENLRKSRYRGESRKWETGRSGLRRGDCSQIILHEEATY